MTTFEQFQALAIQVPLSLRNNRDRIDMPLLCLQEEAGKLGSLLGAMSSVNSGLTTKETNELRDRLSDVLWSVALICKETGITMQEVAAHGIARLEARGNGLDPNQR
jgi:NTP pyrophosphatase (non-canonical NTP hydrolase)